MQTVIIHNSLYIQVYNCVKNISFVYFFAKKPFKRDKFKRSQKKDNTTYVLLKYNAYLCVVKIRYDFIYDVFVSVGKSSEMNL